MPTSILKPGEPLHREFTVLGHRVTEKVWHEYQNIKLDGTTHGQLLWEALVGNMLYALPMKFIGHNNYSLTAARIKLRTEMSELLKRLEKKKKRSAK